jgi:hypothetical protein
VLAFAKPGLGLHFKQEQELCIPTFVKKNEEISSRIKTLFLKTE